MGNLGGGYVENADVGSGDGVGGIDDDHVDGGGGDDNNVDDGIDDLSGDIGSGVVNDCHMGDFGEGHLDGDDVVCCVVRVRHHAGDAVGGDDVEDNVDDLGGGPVVDGNGYDVDIGDGGGDGSDGLGGDHVGGDVVDGDDVDDRVDGRDDDVDNLIGNHHADDVNDGVGDPDGDVCVGGLGDDAVGDDDADDDDVGGDHVHGTDVDLDDDTRSDGHVDKEYFDEDVDHLVDGLEDAAFIIVINIIIAKILTSDKTNNIIKLSST